MSQTSESLPTVVTYEPDAKITLDRAIDNALIAARKTCELNGKYSSECVVAWDIVEELQVERSHHRRNSQIPTSLDYYCYFHPEADECRIYDV
jgi:hypothetical protein